ncbi:MAG TPA: OmpA family protein [Bacteroidales bacterium]|nr:OmpA family protein [Bacteroidales bacterium]
MKKLWVITVLTSAIILTLGSCVSGRKYKSLEDSSRQTLTDRDTLKARNIYLSMTNTELQAKLESLKKESDSLRQGTQKVSAERDRLKEEYNKLLAKVNDMQNAQEDLIKGNVSETRKLLSELQVAQENLQKKEDLLRQLEQSLDTKKASLDEMSFELDKRNAKMAELQKILDDQKQVVQDLKNKVSNALLGFENKGLTVTMKNGKVYVSLEDKLLFKTASWEIDANGRAALKKLAGVLEKNPDIQTVIEGHTDNVPYNPAGGQLKDNWDLSTKRATTVVRTLLEGSKIDPKRLTAAGHSQYLPVDDRNSVEARQKNRRTEIILTPDLTELYKIIDKY